MATVPSDEAGPNQGVSKKKQDKMSKKDPRSWENVMKSSSALDGPAQLELIEGKYRDLYFELRNATLENNKLTKQHAAFMKEKDYNESELTKSVVARARLENICRELQKQNKQIKDENLAKVKEEEERRKEVSLKFADKLSDITLMMDENKERSDQLKDDNLKMAAKLTELYGQFQQREDDIAKVSRQLDLERQFSQATLAKMELEVKAEREMHLQQQAILNANLEKSQANVAILEATVNNLQDRVNTYEHQYEGFETTITKSAKVFDNFKYEITNMTKKVTNLEKESLTWKNKFHDSMKALLEMTDIKKNLELYIQGVDRKNEQLNKLCRQIQVDRSHYLKLLKTHGIEPTPSPVIEKPSEEIKIQKPVKTKISKKEKELQVLKYNLKIAQEELSRVQLEENNVLKSNETDNVTSQVDDCAKDEEVPMQQPTEETNKVLPPINDDLNVLTTSNKEEAERPEC